MSEPELATISGDLSQSAVGFIGSDSGYQTLPTRGKPGESYKTVFKRHLVHDILWDFNSEGFGVILESSS